MYGCGLFVLNVNTLDVAVRLLLSVTVHCNVCQPKAHVVVSHSNFRSFVLEEELQQPDGAPSNNRHDFTIFAVPDAADE